MQFLGLGKACYIVYGSYMDFKMPSNILTVSYVFLNLFLTLLGCVIIFACVGVISEESNTPVEELKHIFKQPAALFTILPQSFGYLGKNIFFKIQILIFIISKVCRNCGLQRISSCVFF